MKNKNTTQEKNSSDTNFPAMQMEEFISLLFRSDDKPMLLYALLDDKQAEFRIGNLVEAISQMSAHLSVIKLRVKGNVGQFDAMEYCSAELLKEVKRFDVAASELIDVIEHIKQIVLDREELASHPSEEDNTRTDK